MDVRLRHSNRQRADARDNTHALGDADRPARIENIEQMRALQAQIKGREDGKAFSLFALRFSLFACCLCIGASLPGLAFSWGARTQRAACPEQSRRALGCRESPFALTSLQWVGLWR